MRCLWQHGTRPAAPSPHWVTLFCGNTRTTALRSISTKTASIWKQGRGVMELTYLHSPRALPFSISSLTRLSVGSGQLDNLPWLSQATKSRSYLLIPPAPQPFHVFPCYPANPPPSSAQHSPSDCFMDTCFLHFHEHPCLPTQTPLTLFAFQMKIFCISEAP